MPFEPKYEILPESQKRLLPELVDVKNLGFALYGGTAISLRLGHRESVDFDFFCEKPLDKRALHAAIPALRRNGGEVLQDEDNAYVVLAPAPNPPGRQAGKLDPADRMVKLSFFGSLDFGRVSEPELTSDGALLVAGMRDLMATKLKVLLQRVELKDSLDIAELLRHGQPLRQGVEDATALWPHFNQHDCLRAITYFDDRELERLTKEDRKLLTETVEPVMEAWMSAYGRKRDEAERLGVALKDPPFVPSAIVRGPLGLSPEELALRVDAIPREQRLIVRNPNGGRGR